MSAPVLKEEPRWDVSEGWLWADGMRQIRVDTATRTLLLWDKKRKAWLPLTWKTINSMWS